MVFEHQNGRRTVSLRVGVGEARTGRRTPCRDRLALVAIAVVAAGLAGTPGCDGRSLGVGDPDATRNPDAAHRPDGDVPPWPDAFIPPDGDGSIPTCVDSPLQGIWTGTFQGTVTVPDTGSLPVNGTVRLEIYCEQDLNVSGEITGSESSGVPFQMDVTGRYLQDLDAMDATFAGNVDGHPATGNLDGNLQSGWPQSLHGVWDVRVEDWDMTGQGSWTASLQ